MKILTRTASGCTDVLTVTKQADGWEVRQTHDATVVRTQTFSDWHRVERAVMRFEQSESNRVIPQTDSQAPPPSQSGAPRL